MNQVARRAAAAVLCAGAAFAGLVWFLNVRGEAPLGDPAGASPGAAAAVPAPPASAPESVARGAYLARVGNCQGCHTVAGGVPYAGGRAVPTPFGDVHAPNLTPDTATGLGAWSPAEFWRAMHHGRSRGGRLLYPAFPYPNYTRMTRGDSDALFAFLLSLPAVAQPNRPHALRFPFDQQAALAVWRALYFRAAEAPPVHAAAHDAAHSAPRSAAWQRGAYLVEGLGHCNACHASRNALGATPGPLDLAGGLMPVQNWYAPSLASAREAGVADWAADDIVALLRDGTVARRGQLVSVAGPMAEVVIGSTRHWAESDLRAAAAYLQALPPSATAASRPPTAAAAIGAAPAAPGVVPDPAAPGPGSLLYERHCAGCHGERGEGAPGIYPALAGNRAVLLPTPANLVHVVLEGGFAPATAGHPRPFGMPPFATVLSDAEVAQVLSHLRGAWGNGAAAVTAVEVSRLRNAR